jgi:glutaconate CoA-transferase subunit B
VHPGHSVDEIHADTGFAFDSPARVSTTPSPTAEQLALLRGRVAKEIAADYPEFAARVWDA